MSHGLETRMPFLDNNLVDFAMQCPLDLKIDQVPSNYYDLNRVNIDLDE